MIRLQHSDFALRRAQWLWLPRVEPLDPRVADGITVEWLWMMWLVYRAKLPTSLRPVTNRG